MRTPSRNFLPSCLSLLLASVALVACGGSQSETPAPLEPLPVNLHYDRGSTALSGEVPIAAADAGAVQRAVEAPAEGPEGPPARSTWGSDHGDKPAPLK